MANPILAAILSFILPGIGQIYAGDTQKGIIFIYAAYDAYQMAKY